MPVYKLILNTCHCSQAGHPSLESNAAQSVLKYFMVNEDAFVQGTHNRIYSYSSGTIFNSICTHLEVWTTAVEEGEDVEDSDEDEDEEGETSEDGGDDADDEEEEEGEQEEEDVDPSLPVFLPTMSPEDMLRKVSHTVRICACMRVYNMFVYAHICAYTNND